MTEILKIAFLECLLYCEVSAWNWYELTKIPENTNSCSRPAVFKLFELSAP